jgi:hypothetical protein
MKDDYYNYIQKNNLKSNFIVGSSAIKKFIKREVGDIDFSLYNKKLRRKYIRTKIKKTGVLFHVNVQNYIDFYKNRYYTLGLTDSKIYKKQLLLCDQIKGYCIVKPEIEIAYKLIKNRPKDINDIKNIKMYYKSEVDWKMVDYFVLKAKSKLNMRVLIVKTIMFLGRLKKTRKLR